MYGKIIASGVLDIDYVNHHIKDVCKRFGCDPSKVSVDLVGEEYHINFPYKGKGARAVLIDRLKKTLTF